MRKILQISYIYSQYLFLSPLRPLLANTTNFEKMSRGKTCKKICHDLTQKHTLIRLFGTGCLEQI